MNTYSDLIYAILIIKCDISTYVLISSTITQHLYWVEFNLSLYENGSFYFNII